MVKRLEQIEAELDSLGEQASLSNLLPERIAAPGAIDLDQAPDLESWSSTVVTAVVKAVWSSPLDADAGEQFRRANRARELRELATPIEFEPAEKPRSRPEPETAKPPSWAWAASKSIS